jgi:hypothetical protein
MYKIRLLGIGTMNPPLYNEYRLIKMKKKKEIWKLKKKNPRTRKGRKVLI